MPNERNRSAQVFGIREARPDEALAIAAVIQAAYAEYEDFYSPESWARYFSMLGDVESHYGQGEIIVEDAGKVIAGAIMFYSDGAASGQGTWPEGWAGILRLAVHPQFRGLGVGRSLVEECIRRAREAGIGTVALHSTAWMGVARGMYERMGFVRDQSFDFVTRSGVLAMGYRLNIDAM